MDSAAAIALGHVEGEEWELRHDEDGFTYKILKRQRLLDPAEAVQPSLPDPEAEERNRKLRKKKTLLKLKDRYQNEIHHWELLSNTLRSMQDKANQHQLQSRDVGQTASPLSFSLESTSMDTEGTDRASGSLTDELLFRAEAQEALINDMACLCDVAESMYNAQQQWLAQPYIDLPVLSSPRKLMELLCDE